jgi:hypothetical protein
MAGECEGCKNLNPNSAIYGAMWTTGPVFEANYLPVVNIIENERWGCHSCSFLLRVIDEFVQNWRPKKDEISLHVIAPDGRPIEVRISEALPNEESLELANVQLSAPEGKINSIRLQGSLYKAHRR